MWRDIHNVNGMLVIFTEKTYIQIYFHQRHSHPQQKKSVRRREFNALKAELK